MNPFEHLVDLASGGSVLFATDDFFQVAESLILENEPIWDADKFTPFGKWMDGWETRRKRIEGHDWCLIKLGLSGTIEGLHIDTAFFTGNQTPRVSIQAACLDAEPKLVRRSEMGTCATEYEIQAACSLESEKWDEILAMSPLKPGYPNDRHHYFHAQSSGKRYTHLRVNYFPDGGVARLRVHGTVQKDWSTIPSTHLIDFLALENGGTPLSCSNKHYGTPFNLLKKTASAGMHDGWETARNPNRPPVFLKGADGHLIMPGKEQATFKLGMPVEGGGVHVETIIVDTAHFKGNYPESILVEGCHLATGSEWREDVVIDWFEIVPRSKCKANTKHRFDVSSLDAHQRKTTHVRLTVFPDGGVARLRVYGRMASLNSCTRSEFETVLTEMFEPAPVLTEFLYAGRPYPNVTALLDLAETVLVKTPRFSESQLVEIVNAHPRLGANKLTVLSEASKREQGKGSEDEDVNRKLADINDKYEAKFKFKLVEFVNGRSRSEMVPVLQKRLEEGTRIQELKKGLQAMVDIARDRIAKKMSCV